MELWIRNAEANRFSLATISVSITRAVGHSLMACCLVFLEKARNFATLLGITDFAGSDGWVSHLKKQLGLGRQRFQGEANSAPLATLPLRARSFSSF
jgi:hypothetical protein